MNGIKSTVGLIGIALCMLCAFGMLFGGMLAGLGHYLSMSDAIAVTLGGMFPAMLSCAFFEMI